MQKLYSRMQASLTQLCLWLRFPFLAKVTVCEGPSGVLSRSVCVIGENATPADAEIICIVEKSPVSSSRKTDGISQRFLVVQRCFDPSTAIIFWTWFWLEKVPQTNFSCPNSLAVVSRMLRPRQDSPHVLRSMPAFLLSTRI